MEMGSVRARRSRETSPDRARACVQPRVKPLRKVEIIYYLCRDGQLEHPHSMEVTHLPNQHLRLKDVMDRLTVLRGRGMPSLYSWSCKRSYKNGYVWNDLSENDVIHPAEGAEYILKGSEIIEGCAERIQEVQVSTAYRRKQVQPPHMVINQNNQHMRRQEEEGGMEQMEEAEEVDLIEEVKEEDEEDKGPNQLHNTSSSSDTTNSRCSRGVSTEELERRHNRNCHPTELPDTPSPPSTSSSFVKDTEATAAIFISNSKHGAGSTHRGSARFDDTEPTHTRSPSLLLQLIACGSVAVKGRTGFQLTRPSSSTSSPQVQVVGNGKNGSSGRKSGASLHRGVLCRLAAARTVDEDDDDENAIRCMSEDPRFGNPQSEEKEYFSGSIVEAITSEAKPAEPSLKKSSSYNEERSSSKCGLGEDDVEEMGERSVKGRCISMPGRRKAAAKKESTVHHHQHGGKRHLS